MTPLGILTVAIALGAAILFDWLAHRAGLTPPAFVVPPGEEQRAGGAMVRRAAAIVLLAAVFWLGVFGALAHLGGEPMTDFSDVGTGALFLLHLIFGIAVVVWYGLGFAGFPQSSWSRQMGLATPSVGREIGVGLLAGAAAWLGVITVLVVVGVVVIWAGGDDALPQQPPAMIPWIVSLPIVVRIAVSASAGFFEELFFRGFLQPRIGIGLSTLFFVLAHANYEQPFMLIGIALLSVIFAALVRWRQNIWPAIAAHALFDAIQLLIVVPVALDFIDGEGTPWLPVAWLLLP